MGICCVTQGTQIGALQQPREGTEEREVRGSPGQRDFRRTHLSAQQPGTASADSGFPAQREAHSEWEQIRPG